MKRVLLATLALGMLAVQAQYNGRTGIRYLGEGSVFTVRRTSDWSQDRRDGRCTIRVRIDDDSDVILRGDQIRIRVLRGGPGRDQGSECNAPLPISGNIRNFQFRGIDGRGNPRLLQPPSSRNNYVAVVNVQDPQSGDEGYTFELTWQWDGQGGGYFPGGRPTTRPSPPSGGGIFDDQPSSRPVPGGNTLQDMNMTVAGNGTLDDGTQRYSLTDVSVRIEGNQCRITLITDKRQRLELTGSVNRNSSRCVITSSNRGRASGNAMILANGSRINSLDVSGNINGRNFQGNFRSR